MASVALLRAGFVVSLATVGAVLTHGGTGSAFLGARLGNLRLFLGGPRPGADPQSDGGKTQCPSEPTTTIHSDREHMQNPCLKMIDDAAGRTRVRGVRPTSAARRSIPLPFAAESTQPTTKSNLQRSRGDRPAANRCDRNGPAVDARRENRNARHDADGQVPRRRLFRDRLPDLRAAGARKLLPRLAAPGEGMVAFSRAGLTAAWRGCLTLRVCGDNAERGLRSAALRAAANSPRDETTPVRRHRKDAEQRERRQVSQARHKRT